ncbi:hypothetical protein F5887DRAFT_1088624 [Amanita rubescens]|nr:hypothetical protein F5887DRAFT_1088624 [Amanita rubescens]
MDVERERIMEIIKKTLQGLHPSMKLVRRVSYREGGHPLVYTVSGRVEPVERPIVYPNGKESWNFISQYELDQALDVALKSLSAQPPEPLAAERSLSNQARALVRRAELITATAKRLLTSGPLSQPHVIAAGSLAAAAISLADAALSLTEKLDVSEVDKTLVDDNNEAIEKSDVGDILKDMDTRNGVVFKAEYLNSVAVRVEEELC